MKLIGLTGTTGSGKGFVSRQFAEYGIPSVDTDALVHRLYRENIACIGELTQTFGDVLASDGSIDRKKLAPIVFSNPARLAKLNAIVHKYVHAEVERIATEYQEKGADCLLIDAPQLYEAGMESMCHAVIAVVAPTDLRIQRICARDGITEEAARARIKNQHSDAFFRERGDYIIENDGIRSVAEQIDFIAGALGYGKTQTQTN